ncbi:MAG: bifunctional DNA-formamidopyrimidine glycosylase/DNA-(apurinic or apyrimidinic site) lyase [Candidatus Omnitrophica bacterium]|nr:bifunctional DNA-formamidopyrimidine glycosylase/DNA-(apurinic or apyrimidinic site) lyase [Candidatus Omnitrophota bacterium]
MPELPEVETIRRDLQQLKGIKIIDVKVIAARVCRNITPEKLAIRIKNKIISDIYRRGKALVFVLSDKKFLTVQLGMTGQLLVKSKQKNVEYDKAAKVVFKLSNAKNLIYNDQRMFGRICAVDKLEGIDYFAALGVEPLGEQFNVKYISEHVARRSIPVKVLLMDQKFVAGIGNIYASEILFEAGIDPRKRSSLLDAKQISAIVKASKRILKESIKNRGTTFRDYRDASGSKGRFAEKLKVYGREGLPCIKCKTLINNIVQAQRSTFYCPKCQI